LLAGGSWVLAGKVVTAFSTLALNAILSRTLETRTYGLYVISFSLVTGAAMLSQLGLHSAVVRLIAESMGTDRQARARSAVTFAYRWMAVGVVVVSGFLLFGGGSWLARIVWDKPALAASMGLIAIWAALQSFQVLTSETFRGFHDIRLASLFGGVITGSLSVLLLGLFALSGRPVTLNVTLALIVISSFSSLALGLFVLRRRVQSMVTGEQLEKRATFGIALPLWINALCAFGLNQSDVLILAAYRTETEVALYGPARMLVGMVIQSMMLVTLVVPPFIAEMYSRGEKKRLERMLRLTATLAGLPALAVLVVYIFFGEAILGLIYSDDYRGGATVLAILSTGRVVSVFAGSAAVTLGMTGHQKILMRITLIAGVITVGTALLVVERYGGVGVATVIASGVVLQHLMNWAAARRYTGMWTHVGLPRLSELRSLWSR
jgi:O-antigen/teichoic acid export membrane protein